MRPPKKPKKRQTDTVKLMEEQCAVLRQQLQDLGDARSNMLHELRVLKAWCACMRQFARIQADEQRAGRIAAESISEQLELLQQQEQQALQQLGAAADLAAAEPELEYPMTVCCSSTATAAPAGNPVAYMLDLLSRPPLPVNDLTAQELAVAYRAAVGQVSILLHHLATSAQQEPPLLERLKNLLDRHFHTLVSLVAAGKQDVMNSFLMIHLDTLEIKEQSVVDRHDAAATEAMVTAVELTEQQEADMARGLAMCKRLLSPLNHEWQQLQHKLSKDSGSTCSSGGGGGGGSSPSVNAPGSSTTTAAAAEPAIVVSRGSQLDAHQQRLSRLQVVMHKRLMIQVLTAGWCVGCLSWLQLGKIAVLGYPYLTCFMTMWNLVDRQREQRQQQQQPQEQRQEQQEQQGQEQEQQEQQQEG